MGKKKLGMLQLKSQRFYYDGISTTKIATKNYPKMENLIKCRKWRTNFMTCLPFLALFLHALCALCALTVLLRIIHRVDIIILDCIIYLFVCTYI